MSLPSKVTQKFPYGLERNTYFFGKLLTAEDFNLEQAYFLAREALLNASFFGPGIITGLEVTDFKDLENRVSFTLKAGLALDAQGHIILVPRDQVLELEIPTRTRLGLFLFYEECPREPTVTVCDPKECQYNRVREGFRLELAPESGEGIKLADLILQEGRYHLLPVRKPDLGQAELPSSSRLLDLREILGVLLKLAERTQRLEEELYRFPRFRQKEFNFLYRIGSKHQRIVYGSPSYPIIQVYPYLPSFYEISPDRPDIKYKDHQKEIERGEIYLVPSRVKDFLQPPPREPVAPMAPSAPIFRVPTIRKFHYIRRLSPQVKLKEMVERTSQLGIRFKVDPRLSLEKPLAELEDAYLYSYLHPVFDGGLLSYLSINLNIKEKEAFFHFDFEAFQKDEPELYEFFKEKLKGILFRLIFLVQ